MTRSPQRPQHELGDLVPVAHQRPHQRGIRPAIAPQAGRRVGHRPVQHRGTAVIERMRGVDLGLQVFEPVALEREPREKW